MWAAAARHLQRADETACFRFFQNLYHEKDTWKFRELQPEIINALTVDQVKAMIISQLDPSCLELSVSGDFEADELEENINSYLGTLTCGAGVKQLDAQKLFELGFTSGQKDSREVCHIFHLCVQELNALLFRLLGYLHLSAIIESLYALKVCFCMSARFNVHSL